MAIKKLGLVGLALVIGIGLWVWKRNPSGGNRSVLRVCTWSNYFPEGIVKEFTEKTGVKVEFSYISSNEELFAKLKAGATGFDLIQPSDYMVRQMRDASMLQPLDKNQLPNLQNLEPMFQHLGYDPDLKYSIPFSWGTTGLAVNTEKVAVEGPVHWSLLFESKDPKHTALLDDMREVFVAVSLWKKVSPTFRTREDLERAKTALDTAKNSILMFTSEPRPLLLRNELTVAQAYSTDAYQAARENPKIKYFLPEEGGTFWTDNFSIPTSSLQAKEAHLFINYFLDGDIARRTALLNHSATPNRTAREGLPAEIKNDPSLYPSPERLKKLPMIDDLGDLLPEMNRLWTELKS